MCERKGKERLIIISFNNTKASLWFRLKKTIFSTNVPIYGTFFGTHTPAQHVFAAQGTAAPHIYGRSKLLLEPLERRV
jgi:hypothetical protein